MPILTILLVILIVGVLLWLVNTYVPMDRKIKSIFNIVVVIILIIWLLDAFGLINMLNNVRVQFIFLLKGVIFKSEKLVTKSDMQKIYTKIELLFEQFPNIANHFIGKQYSIYNSIYHNSLLVEQPQLYTHSLRECIRAILHGLIFLSLFIIQRSFNKLSSALHLKVNELVASHELARNTICKHGKQYGKRNCRTF